MKFKAPSLTSPSRKALAASALVATMSFSPVSPLVRAAHADGGDVVAGLIIGGILGAAINEGSKKKKATPKAKGTKSAPKSTMPPEVRASNKSTQDALNYFGWNVGTADGVLGNRSKAAIRDYQGFLGEGMTGELTDGQRSILHTAHARALAGGPVIQDIVAGSHHGVRNVLLAQRDEMRGGSMMAAAPIAPPPAVVAAPAAMPDHAPVVPVAPQPAVPVLITTPAAPAPAAVPTPAPVEVAATPSLPSFMDVNGAKGSLAAECNRVTLAVNTRGGYATEATMGDAGQALSEQLCLTRASAIATGQDMAARVSGVSASDIAAQCAAFAPVMKDHVAALSLRPAGEVLKAVEGFVLTSGMAPAQLSGTAKVCLGVGYEQDSLDVALGSALLLAALGEGAYAELPGHHLAQGYGANQRPDLALGWYELSLATMGAGKDVFLPGMSGRDALVRKAAWTAAGRGHELAPKPEVRDAALPTFSITPEAPAPTTAVPAIDAKADPAPAPAPAAVLPKPDAAPGPVQLTGTPVDPSAAQEPAGRLPVLIVSGN